MLVLLLVPCGTCLQEPAQRVGGQGCEGRRAASSSSALGAAQGRHQHHSVAAPGRRVTGRVSAVCGMQGDAGAVRPACDVHGGTRAVVLRSPHRSRCTASQGDISTAAVQVQQGVSSVKQWLQECCGHWSQHSCQKQNCCQGSYDCCWCILRARSDYQVGGTEDRITLCMARQQWGRARCIVAYHSVPLHTDGRDSGVIQHALWSGRICWVCRGVHGPRISKLRASLPLSGVLLQLHTHRCVHLAVRVKVLSGFVELLSASCVDAGWNCRCLVMLYCISSMKRAWHAPDSVMCLSGCCRDGC
jgi:hypothetical protein